MGRQRTSSESTQPSLPVVASLTQAPLLAVSLETPLPAAEIALDTTLNYPQDASEPATPELNRPVLTLVERADVVTMLLTIIIAVILIHVGLVLSHPNRSPQGQRVGSVRFITNVNTAPASEISLLPGIGPALAQRIVLDRETNGPFESLDDLGRVRGIGPKTIIQIKPLVVFSFATLDDFREPNP